MRERTRQAQREPVHLELQASAVQWDAPRPPVVSELSDRQPVSEAAQELQVAAEQKERPEVSEVLAERTVSLLLAAGAPPV